jgi:hypothetical protein
MLPERGAGNSPIPVPRLQECLWCNFASSVAALACDAATFLPLTWLPPWSTVLPEKLAGPQLVKKFLAFYGTRMFITAFAIFRLMSLSCARSIQSKKLFQFLKFHFTIILPNKTTFQVLCLSQISRPNPVCTSTLLHTCYIPRPSHFSWLDHPNNLWEVYRTLSSSVTSSLSTRFLNNLRLCSSLKVRDRVSHPYKTTGRIIVLYILIFISLYNKLKDKRSCTKW